jgi:aquaglyceroporin related protein
MILIFFGNGVNCQVVLTASSQVAETQSGSYLSISFGA